MTIQRTIDFDTILNELNPGYTMSFNVGVSKITYLQQYRTITMGSGRQKGHTEWIISRFLQEYKNPNDASVMIVSNRNFKKGILDSLKHRGCSELNITLMSAHIYTVTDVLQQRKLQQQQKQYRVVYIDNALRSNHKVTHKVYDWLTRSTHDEPLIVNVVNG